MLRRLLVPAVGAMLACASPALAAQAKAARPSVGDAVRGKQLYGDVGCWQCHGTVGQGGAGSRLAPSPMPIQAFAGYVRSPALEMPPYPAAILSAKDIVDIHAFLAAIPASPPPAGLKLLSPP